MGLLIPQFGWEAELVVTRKGSPYCLFRNTIQFLYDFKNWQSFALINFRFNQAGVLDKNAQLTTAIVGSSVAQWQVHPVAATHMHWGKPGASRSVFEIVLQTLNTLNGVSEG